MSESSACPECGAPVPQGATCPRCLMALAEAPRDPREGTEPLNLSDLPMPGESRVIADKYTILETIACGGMGVVYKARQENLNRVVAVKMLLGGIHAGEDYKRRFLLEAKAAARLNHPNIVSLHDWGEDSGQPYFSMDYIEGQTLADMARAKPLPPREAAEIVRTLAAAMHYAHSKGILHRDLKPSNVLVDAAGVPQIADFGLAREINQQAMLTSSGGVLGTPGFLPPEQASGNAAKTGPHSDVYGLGAILYYLLTSRPPHVANSVAEALRAVQESEPVSPRRLNPSVPVELETICLKCLEKDPARRYLSAEALADDLGRWQRHEPIRARPAGALTHVCKWVRRKPAIAALAATLVAALITGFVVVLGQSHQTWLQAVRADAEAARARQEAERARRAIRVLIPVITHAADSLTQGENKRLLGEAIAVARSADQAESLEIAESVLGLADGFQKRGDLPQAETLCRDALAIVEKYYSATNTDYGDWMVRLISILIQQSKYAEAESFARKCLQMRGQRQSRDREVFNAEFFLGASLVGQKRFNEAERFLRSAHDGLEPLKQKVENHGRNIFHDTLRQLVQLYEATGRSAQAAEYKQRLDAFEKAASKQ